MSVIIKKSDALSLCKVLKPNSVDFIYTDPPYNTGKIQANTYKETGYGYLDKFDDFKGFIYPIFKEFKRILKDNAMLFVHLDRREVHYAKVWLDEIFGRDRFLGEIIWHLELGAVGKKFWAQKHTTILCYCKTDNYKFHIDKVPRLKKETADGTKLMTSVWNLHISPYTKEQTGYPNQKPEILLEHLLNVHTDKGDLVLDPFCGSGTTAAVADRLGRNSITCDINDQALEVARKRIPKAR